MPAKKPQLAEEEIDDPGDLEFEINAEPEDHDYQLPPSTLLDSIPAADQSDEYKKIEQNIKVLEKPSTVLAWMPKLSKPA